MKYALFILFFTFVLIMSLAYRILSDNHSYAAGYRAYHTCLNKYSNTTGITFENMIECNNEGYDAEKRMCKSFRLRSCEE